MPNYTYPPMENRRLIGKRFTRLDGVEKASGKAKYNSDVRPKSTIHAVGVFSAYAHAKIKSIDTSAAEKAPGFAGVSIVNPVGTELNWAGQEIAFVAATTEEQARTAASLVKVDYEIMPHLVREESLSKAGARAKPAGEVVTGDPDAAFSASGTVTHEGEYGIPVITHCCLEPHGQTVAFDGAANKIEYWPSTQNVSAVGGDLAKNLELPATSIHVHQDHIGGGFGSKFQSDLWGLHAAKLSKMAGGKPVKLYLDRREELTIAGVRPSVFGKIKLGCTQSGELTAWDSTTWMTGGFAGGGLNADLLPYVFRNVANRRINHTAVSTNNGASRAWRAPNHPQVCYITQAAMEDLAAKIKMDPMEFFLKNLDKTARADTYKAQITKAADMIQWKQNWKPRGSSTGTVKRGLGLAIGTWNGAGHASRCRAIIQPDGSALIEIGSQDIGTGTRTIITQVVAETLGLQMNMIAVKLGDNNYPPSGASGGSTTVGGVTASSRKASVNALEKLFAAVAPSLGVPPEQLEAVDAKIQVKGTPSKSLTWKAACAKLGVNPISEEGANDPRNPGGLTTGGVGGCHMADVSVDTETGIVKINKVVAVQDVGMVVNPKTCDSQMYGGVIMGICAAIFEERVMDEMTGRFLNADMEFYKLAGAGDIGEIEVLMEVTPEHDKRGVIGVGEPSTVPVIAAVANAVANAIGVRVPVLPLTPKNVLNALSNSTRRFA